MGIKRRAVRSFVRPLCVKPFEHCSRTRNYKRGTQRRMIECWAKQVLRKVARFTGLYSVFRFRFVARYIPTGGSIAAIARDGRLSFTVGVSSLTRRVSNARTSGRSTTCMNEKTRHAAYRMYRLAYTIGSTRSTFLVARHGCRDFLTWNLL